MAIEINRRDFLKMSAAAAAGTMACSTMAGAMELELGGTDFHQLRTFHPRKRKPYLCTLCPYFDGGYTFSEQGRVKKIEGNPNHIATRGKFCAKGLASFLAASDPDRIRTPLKRVGRRGEGKWREIGWEEAIAEVAERMASAIDSGGADSVHLNDGGFKAGAAERFMATIGSKSIMRSRPPSIGGFAKSRALMQMFGVDFMLPDLENTRYVLNFGANIMETAPPLAQRLADGIVAMRAKLVTFDVRMSNTAGRSDEWIPLFPGTDSIVALAMANVIMAEGLADRDFIDQWTNITPDLLARHLAQYTPEKAEQESGVAKDTIERIAVEFAKTKPATIISHNGVVHHKGGVAAEKACSLLAIITGNIDTEGGYCLSRRFNLLPPQPAPVMNAAGDEVSPNLWFPFEVKTGRRKVSVFLNHLSNPAYSSPAASLWKEVLKDESLIPFIVDFSPFMSETADLADIILPDLVEVEKYDLASSPTALLPWVSMGVPAIDHQGQAQDVRVTLKKIIEAMDGNGEKGMKRYWAFADGAEWVKQEVEATAEIAESYKKLKSKGVYPNYGKLDASGRKIINKGKVVKAEYHTYAANGFPTPSGKVEIARGTPDEGLLDLPSWEEGSGLARIKPEEFVFTTFKVAYHTLSRTSNLKYLAELWHSNPLWINQDVAREMGIADGALVRLVTDAGYLVTKAWVTRGIHPRVVAMSTSVGRTAYGKVAMADPEWRALFSSEHFDDPDIDHNLWWQDSGTNPNDIVPLCPDPETGSQAWNSVVVSVIPAVPGDEYGQIQVDNGKHIAVYEKLLSDKGLSRS